MAGSRPNGQWLFSESVQALRRLKSQFEALDRDAPELAVRLLYRQTPSPCEPEIPCPLKLNDRGEWVPCLSGQNPNDVIPLSLTVEEKATAMSEGWGGQLFDLIGGKRLSQMASWEAETGQAGMRPCQRRFVIDRDHIGKRRLLSIAKEAASLIANVIEASPSKDARLSLWPDIPVDVELAHHAGYWFDLVFEVGRWRLPSVPFRCEIDPPDKVLAVFNGLPGKEGDRLLIDAVNRKVDEKRDLLTQWNIDPTTPDFWTKHDQPPLMQMTLEGFASKSAAVIDLLIQWGETGANPFQSRLKADPWEHDGNELNFDFPPKTPNKDFQLRALNHAIERFGVFLRQRGLMETGDPEIRWSADQWSEDYWPNVRREMELIWSSLPEDSRQLYPYGYEWIFERLEEFLQEVKFRYFESINHVAQCPFDESLLERVEWHTDVLKGCSEPSELRESGGTKGTAADSPVTLLAQSPSGDSAPNGQLAEAEFVFRPDGDGYFLKGFGKQGHVSGLKGLDDLFRLVQTPGVPVLMLQLSAGLGEKPTEGDERSRQPVADREAMEQLAAKRKQLLADIENIEPTDPSSDMERSELQAKLDLLNNAVRSMTGLRGKPRDINNLLDRLRPKLTNRIKTVYRKLRKENLKKLADHFEATVSSESDCFVYRPGLENLTWDITQL